MNATATITSGQARPALLMLSEGPGIVLDLPRLVSSRLLVQANSGGGKSRALRYLLEQTHGRVQHLVFDPEGEFSSLRERFDYVLVGEDGDLPAAPSTADALCRRLLELDASAVINLYALPLRERRRFVRVFLEALMHLPRTQWRPVLIVIDEIQVFAPERNAGEAESTDAIIALATQGRKRGFALCGATQRLSRLHKDVAAELLNKLIGRTSLDVDLRRAGDELGLDRERRGMLKALEPGTFYAFGPAFERSDVVLVRTGDVHTTHPHGGMQAAAPPPAPPSMRELLAHLRSELLGAPPNEEAGRRQTALESADVSVRIRELETALTHERVARQRAEATLAEWLDRSEIARRLLEQTLAVFEPLRQMEERDVAALSPAPVSPEKQTVSPKPSRPSRRAHDEPGQIVRATDSQTLTLPQQRVLNALADFEALGVKHVARHNLAVWADQSPRSSGFANNLGRLRTLGLIDYPSGGAVTLTQSGRAHAVADAKPTSSSDLLIAWKRKLKRPQVRILEVLVRAYPNALERTVVGAQAQQSPSSSGFANNLGALRSLGLIDYLPGRKVVATNLVFLPQASD